MAKESVVSYFIIFNSASLIMGAVPGTFFWKPRLGLDLNVPKAGAKPDDEIRPSFGLQSIRDGKTVIVEGYQTGMTILALSNAYLGQTPYHHINPFSAKFYTNSWRWTLRHINLLPPWLGGNAGTYCETQKLWKSRFRYMNSFVPMWLRKMLFFVRKADWEQEEKEHRRFQKYVEPAFGQHYRYPNHEFNDYASQKTPDSAENKDRSSSSGDTI